MYDNLELQLNEIKINTVKNYKIEDNNDELYITIKNYNGDTISVIFKDVKGYFYQDFEGINNISLKKLSPNLDFISYYQKGFARFTEINLSTAEEFNISVPNFAINLIDSTLYVDANIIEINGDRYQINYYN